MKIIKTKNVYDSQISNLKFNEGFTLVELLASVIVLIAVGSVIAGIISSSLRGANKTNAIENIRQNGNYALSQISKDIEYAQPFDGENTGLSNDGTTYVTSCPFSSSSTPAPVVTTYNYITVQSANNIVTKYSCSGSTPQDSVLTANGMPLIDMTEATSISLENCSLMCVQNEPMDIPIIKISFSIGPKNSNNLVENSNPPITFETSVTLRNYEK